MDSELTGFGVRVLASGVRTYFIRYRVGGGRRAQMRRLTIGRHGHLTTEQAREAARKALASVSLGGDPAASKAAAREALTVSELLDEWLAGPGKRNRHGKLRSKGSYACDEGRFSRHVKPILGRVKLPELDRADIDTLRDGIFFNDTATTESYALARHDALPIEGMMAGAAAPVAHSQAQCLCDTACFILNLGQVPQHCCNLPTQLLLLSVGLGGLRLKLALHLPE